MMSYSIVLLIIVCTITACHADSIGEKEIKEEWLQVNIAQEPVRGRRDPSGDFHVFHNIPYATAPTGKDKFKAPLPPPTWEEPYDAIDKRIICPQFRMPEILPADLNMQENCLIANVYVPNTNDKNLTVLVYVHGGGFQGGYGDMGKMRNLMMAKDLIVVNFNYRVGIHGFLCLGTEDAPGNGGMKDQLALLRWVRRNIAAFGGDPNDVTISDSSAGSASVDLLMISKAAEGLFNKVIPESGANLAVFTIQSDPIQIAKNHARTLNFTNVDDINALGEFYKTISFELLTADFFFNRPDSTLQFVPCVEHHMSNEAFLTDTPLNILSTGEYKKVPMLYGFANMEGLLRTTAFFDEWKDKMNEKFSDFLPADLQFNNEDEKEKVAKLIKEFYFGDKPIGTDNILGYVDFFSDVMFAYSTLRAVNLHVEGGHDQIYLYEYSFVDDDTPVVPYTNIRGADHCAQSMAIFDGKNIFDQTENDISDEYSNMKKILREMWHNFIMTGKPVSQQSSQPSWPPVGKNLSPHMSLGQKIELKGSLLEERYNFWNKIYDKYYKQPIPPVLVKRHTEL